MTRRYASRVIGDAPVTVRFSDRMTKTIAEVSRGERIVTYSIRIFMANRNNQSFKEDIVKHECIHLRYPYHDKRFKAMCRQLGADPSPCLAAGKYGYRPLPRTWAAQCCDCDMTRLYYNCMAEYWRDKMCPGCGGRVTVSRVINV